MTWHGIRTDRQDKQTGQAGRQTNKQTSTTINHHHEPPPPPPPPPKKHKKPRHIHKQESFQALMMMSDESSDDINKKMNYFSLSHTTHTYNPKVMENPSSSVVKQLLLLLFFLFVFVFFWLQIIMMNWINECFPPFQPLPLLLLLLHQSLSRSLSPFSRRKKKIVFQVLTQPKLLLGFFPDAMVVIDVFPPEKAYKEE